MLEATPKQLEEYLTPQGRSPLAEWFNRLKDRKARARIRVRLDRLSLGTSEIANPSAGVSMN